MKRIRILQYTCALVAAVVLGSSSLALASCGDSVVDPGESCDTGTSQLDVGCCDATCHWRSNGDPCTPGGGDSCHQGTCGSGHSCDAASPPIDPCLGTSNCNECVSTGPKTQNFTCTGADVADGTACTSGGNHCKVCVSGACTGDKVCPQPGNSCDIASCVTNTGLCDTDHRSPGTFCNDGLPCTYNEQCDSSGHCNQSVSNVANNTACDDHNDCTTGEKCNGSGSCTSGTNVTNGTACDDFNDCADGTTCTNGVCGGGSLNATGTACVGANICRAAGTCQNVMGIISFCNPGAAQNEGAVCTQGNPCNDGFCSAGNCIVRDPSQQSGTVEDYNVCTDSSSTTCNAAGLVVGTSCTTGTCPVCANACGTDPNRQLSGASVPCDCISAQ